MFSKKYKKPKKLKIFLISVILIISAGLITVFWNYRRGIGDQHHILATIQNKASLSIDRVHQTATRDGIKEWSLNASSAQYLAAKNQAVFKDLSVTFFMKNKRKIYLTANQGILKTDSNDIEVIGNVVVDNESYRLKTDNLHYKHDQRIFFTKVPVNIVGKAFNIVADSMFFDLNTNKTSFEGQVEGTFSENFRL